MRDEQEEELVRNGDAMHAVTTWIISNIVSIVS